MVISLSERVLKLLHQAVVEKYPKKTVSGYMLESMIKGSMDYAMTEVYGYKPYPDVITKASVLLHSIITFHPFTDGNKRTALLATYFFLHFNGYTFRITEEAIQLTKQIASREVKEMKYVIKWLAKHTRRGFFETLMNKLFYSELGEREMAMVCITMLGGISGLLRPFERYQKKRENK